MNDDATNPQPRIIPSTIDLTVEVEGTPEEVWRAVATGPGITSWYVKSTVEERVGGAVTSEFGPGEGMTVHGQVDVWEPPHRVVFSGGESAGGGLAFEWIVEAHGGGLCTVRLINSGFGNGGPWDDQYDAMSEGWRLFLANLPLHLRHFKGQDGQPMLPMAMWPMSPEAAWARLAKGLGIPSAPMVGERITASTGAVGLGGTVLSANPGRSLSLLLDEPAPGTALVAVEGAGEGCGVSIWQYLYGERALAIIERDLPVWVDWLAAQAAPDATS